MIQESAYGLTQLVLLCNNKQSADPKLEPQSDDVSFWCYCETAEEISLMMNEVRSFAPHVSSARTLTGQFTVPLRSAVRLALRMTR